MTYFDLPDDMVEVCCSSMEDLREQVKSRRAPVVKPLDNPMKLLIGLYVPKTKEWFTCSLANPKVKRENWFDVLSSLKARESFARSLQSKEQEWEQESI